MAKRLVVLAGPDEGRDFVLGAEPFLLGRSRATESKLIDPHVSRVHCQVHLEDNRYIVSDFDSAAGTYVNGRRVSKHPLQSGDLIRIGNTRLQFCDDAATVKPPVVPASASQEARIVEAHWAKQIPGQKLAHYKIGAILARGKAGYIFHARDTRKNLDVALKILDPRHSGDDNLVKRFVEAMKTVLPLKHPNLVKVHGAGRSGPYCWVAMEYISGESLAAVIGRIEPGTTVDWRNVLRMMVVLARVLDYAHGKKIVHQSVTPQNILVGKSLQHTKLADLMLASALERDPAAPINSAGEPSDELPFMSPERTDGPGKSVDARTDIYSLAATCYALLAGHAPFQAPTAQEMVAKIRLQAPASLKSHNPNLPETFESILRKMLAKRPEDRYQSCGELLEELQGVAREHEVAV